MTYDAILLVSFGGPEGMADVIPFLENVLRGRNVPRERMLQVARHYELFDGISPINNQNRKLIGALQAELSEHGPHLPIYWGNRNWHPLLPDTLRQMTADGIKHALAFVTSAYSSYSSCRQYLEDIARAQETAGPQAPKVDKIRAFYNHPSFIEANTEHVRAALAQIPEHRRGSARLAFTAHSVPRSMADNCAYERQLTEASRLVAEALGVHRWKLVYQSRSGPPTQPWLEPDICDHLRELNSDGVSDVVIAPIGFISDHMEVVYDLDTQAKQLAEQLGMNMVRSRTAGTHPAFISMIRELINDRVQTGTLPADRCLPDCCLLKKI